MSVNPPKLSLKLIIRGSDTADSEVASRSPAKGSIDRLKEDISHILVLEVHRHRVVLPYDDTL